MQLSTTSFFIFLQQHFSSYYYYDPVFSHADRVTGTACKCSSEEVLEPAGHDVTSVTRASSRDMFTIMGQGFAYRSKILADCCQDCTRLTGNSALLWGSSFAHLLYALLNNTITSHIFKDTSRHSCHSHIHSNTKHEITTFLNIP